MAWITPVTDRTAADVTALNEKGTFNPTAANRIESNTEYLSDLLDSLGYNNTETHVTDWDRSDFPYAAQMERIRSNVALLVSVYHATGTTVPVSLEHPNFTDMNNVELVLSELNDMIERMVAAFYYSGEIFAGEGW